VTLTDVDAGRIADLAAGRAPFYEPGMDEAVGAALGAGTLAVTTDPAPPADAAFSVVCVPTPAGAGGVLSMSIVEAAVGTLLDRVGPDHSIVIRSTMPLDGPDRLDALVAGRLSRPRIAVNPEFMREGNALRDFDEPGRVVVGWLTADDRAAAEAFGALYAPLDRPLIVTDARTAALVKLGSNVFLATKISFANELARLADAIGADAGDAIEAIGLDERIGRAFLNPGPGYGGSCLPEQAVALDREAVARDVPAPLLAGVALANATHQRAIVDRMAADLGGSLAGRRIAVLGLAFKARTDDVRHSPGIALAAELRRAGADVVGHDPRAGENARRADPELPVADDVGSALDGADAVLVATEWAEYATLEWATLAGRLRGRLVHDTRNIVDVAAADAAGIRVVPLGRAAATAASGQVAPAG
jgi:UDPglucose 6-dehydrogenase